jgi:ArsR family transcriptional regulator
MRRLISGVYEYEKLICNQTITRSTAMTGMDHEELAHKLSALGHPTRLAIIMALTDGEQYLSEVAKRVGVSRALAKVHLKKLRDAGLVETRVVTLEDEARALRYYKLRPFNIHLSPETLKEE